MVCSRCGSANKYWGWLSEYHTMPYSWYTNPPHEVHSDTQIGPQYSWSSAIGILCNFCWLDLWTPQARWPYYERHLAEQGAPHSKYFVVEENLYQDYTYDEELMIAVGNPVIVNNHDMQNTKMGFVSNIFNHTVTVDIVPLSKYGSHTCAKQQFECYFTRTGLDQRLHKQVSSYNWSERERSGLLQD